jgi:RluA family pseudouridine synthase
MEIDPASMILWADEALLAVDKPAGLPVLPDGYHKGTPYLRSVLEPAYGRLWTVHRLDKWTSGVVVLARTVQAHRALNTQFQEHTTGKIYHALVRGIPEWDEKLLEAALLADGDRHHRTIVDPQRGKPASTHFRLLERFTGCALVEAAPRTGRTHQIRAHLVHLGHPILADELYGSQRQGQLVSQLVHLPIDRLALHAGSLQIEHPITGEEMTFTAPYAQDFQAALRQLRSDDPPAESQEPLSREDR